MAEQIINQADWLAEHYPQLEGETWEQCRTRRLEAIKIFREKYPDAPLRRPVAPHVPGTTNRARSEGKRKRKP